MSKPKIKEIEENILKELVLYKKEPDTNGKIVGENGKITLAKTDKVLKDIEIHAKYGNSYKVYQKVVDPKKGDIVNISGGMINQTANTAFRAETNYTLSTTTDGKFELTPTYFGEFGMHNTAFSSKENRIFIYKVVGHVEM